MNGYPNGAHGIGADAWQSNEGPGNPRGPGSPYPPIAEIIASATDTAESLRHHSVGTSGRRLCLLVVRR